MDKVAIRFLNCRYEKNIREFSFKEKSISIGLVAGVIIGATTDNIGLWLPLGIAFGAAGAFIKKS